MDGGHLPICPEYLHLGHGLAPNGKGCHRGRRVAMATAEDNPAGYYMGRPMNYDEQKAPVLPAKEAVHEKVNTPVQGIPGYYAGRVTPAASDDNSAVAHPNGEPGFLAKCLAYQAWCASPMANAR